MKKQFLFASIILSSTLFFACGNNNNSSESNDAEETDEKSVIENLSDAGDAVKGLSGLEKAMKDVETQTNALKAKSPVTNDELKNVLPESLDGLKRKSIRVGDSASLGISTANASYENEDGSKTLDISIMDGAGEAASAITGLAFYGFNTDSEEISDDRTEKTTEFKGQRAKLTESKYNEELTSTIEWIQKKRYLMKIEGKTYTIDQLGNLMDKLNLDKLPE
ncbi:hypothetical protein [Sphingobacterium endophyticum]|uniref:hypothetical protein n=1 Tax=Sphingobacterium endophyticum TaxID=2546448 RepID=UPI0012E1C6C3|nr:hypothetical protein [Sphingobacterium endophyticum]